MKNVLKTITWIFSLVLVVTLVSCEKEIDLKGGSMIGDPIVDGDYGPGLYHSYWNEDADSVGTPNYSATTVFYIDTAGGVADFTAVNKTPFDFKCHIAMDEAGLMYLLDEETGDIYTWTKADADAPVLILAGAGYHTIPSSKIQFTQAVVGDYDYMKYLIISNTKPGYEIVYLIDVSTVLPSLMDTIDLNGRIDIEGADLAVSAGAPDFLRLFTKSTASLGSNLYEIKLADKSITPLLSNPGTNVTGCAELNGRMWISKGEKNYISAYSPDFSSEVQYPITGDAPAHLVFGDLASNSPQWPQDVFFHSQWIGKGGMTKIYSVVPDIPAKEAEFFEINKVPFQNRLHIAEDLEGYLWLIDENTADVYKWAPSNVLPLGAPVFTGASLFPGLTDFQFTQAVIAHSDRGQLSHLFVADMVNDTVYRIDITMGSPTYGTVIQKITADWDVSGGDLVVTEMSDKLYLFTKAEDSGNPSTEKVWMIDLAAGPSVSPVVNESAAGVQINGSVWYGGTVFLSKGTNKLETWGIGDLSTDVYTLINAPRLHYGDLAAKSPIWLTMAPW